MEGSQNAMRARIRRLRFRHGEIAVGVSEFLVGFMWLGLAFLGHRYAETGPWDKATAVVVLAIGGFLFAHDGLHRATEPVK